MGPSEADQKHIQIYGLQVESHHSMLAQRSFPSGREVQEYLCTLFAYSFGKKDMAHEWEKSSCMRWGFDEHIETSPAIWETSKGVQVHFSSFINRMRNEGYFSQ